MQKSSSPNRSFPSRVSPHRQPATSLINLGLPATALVGNLPQPSLWFHSAFVVISLRHSSFHVNPHQQHGVRRRSLTTWSSLSIRCPNCRTHHTCSLSLHPCQETPAGHLASITYTNINLTNVHYTFRKCQNKKHKTLSSSLASRRGTR